MAVKVNLDWTTTAPVINSNIPIWTGKFSPPKPAMSAPPIDTQVNELKAQTQGKTMDDIYWAMIASRPTSTEIEKTIWQNTWLTDKMVGARMQMQDIRRQMLWDQSHIFNATNPDWTPIDPRVKVAQYQANMKSYADRVDQLWQLENVYQWELSTLSKAEQERINAENEKNKVALQYLKDVADTDYRNKTFEENKRQFNVSKDIQQNQFDISRDDRRYEFEKTLNKPEKVQNPDWTYSYISPSEDWISLHWDWKITYMGWRVAWDEGVDIAWNEGFAVTAPFGWTVSKVFTWNDKYFWSYVEVTNQDGTKTRISHLDPSSITAQVWQPLNAGQYFANQKNTWTVIAKPWRWVIDITMFDKNGQKIKWTTTANILKNIKNTAKVQWAPAQTSSYSPMQDANLVQIWSSAEWWLFQDKITGKTITWNQAMSVYWASSKANSSSYSPDDYMNLVIQWAGWASKLSDYDSKRIEKQIPTWIANWLNPQEALLKYKWFVIEDKKNLPQATQVFNVFNNMKAPPSWFEARVSNFINKWDTANLNNYVNTALDREISDVNKAEATSTPYMNVLNQTTKELVALISKNKDKLGAFDWRVNEFYSKLAKSSDFQKIKTLLQSSQATQRKFFAGSAVTPTEMEALKDFIGGTQNMNADNLITQLQMVQEQAQKKYDSQRSLYLWDLNVWNPSDKVNQSVSSSIDTSNNRWSSQSKGRINQ